MPKEKSKLELLSELFAGSSGKEFIISGNIEDFSSIRKELNNFGSEEVSYNFETGDNPETVSKKGDRFSISYYGITFHFMDSTVLQSVFNTNK